jgi:peptide-methionine (S)-S-oxide reductase
MLKSIEKIAFGGGCHWCTEAVFQSIIGVEKVEQGYVASTGENSGFSEAVILHFKPEIVTLKRIIEIHLYTHKSTSNHSMRQKYRSAVYTYSASQLKSSKDIIDSFQPDFNFKIITQVYPFKSFKTSRDELLNYYKNDPEKPFCKTFIDPKLKLLLEQFSENIDPNIKGS